MSNGAEKEKEWGRFFLTKISDDAWKQHGDRMKAEHDKTRNLEVREDAVMEVMDFYNLGVILGEKFADFAYDAASVLAVDHKEAAEVI